MYYILVIVIPVALFILWNVYKDRQEKYAATGHPRDWEANAIEAYQWTPEFHSMTNTLNSIDMTDRDNLVVPKQVLGVAGLIAMKLYRDEGIDPYTVPEKDRMSNVYECAGSLVGYAQRDEMDKLAYWLLAVK